MPKYAELPAFREQNYITEADGDMLHRGTGRKRPRNRTLLLADDFLDPIFDSPETIHELVTDADLSKILEELKPHLKNMLYYLFLRDYSATEYAESIGQSADDA